MNIDTISGQILFKIYTYYLKQTKSARPMHAAAPGAATAPGRSPRTPARCGQRVARKDAVLGDTGGSWTVLRHRSQFCDARQEGLMGERNDVTRSSLNRALRRNGGVGDTARQGLLPPPPIFTAAPIFSRPGMWLEVWGCSGTPEPCTPPPSAHPGRGSRRAAPAPSGRSRLAQRRARAPPAGCRGARRAGAARALIHCPHSLWLHCLHSLCAPHAGAHTERG